MDLKWILCIVLIACLSETISSCEITNVEYEICNYTVVCEVNAGKVNKPSCDTSSNSETTITFIITKSVKDIFTYSFFSLTNFDIRVKTIKAYQNVWPIIESSAFRFFYNCFRLDVTNNAISEIRDEAFKNMKYLRYLNLSMNNIETLHTNTFLIRETLNVVQELDLSYNKLTALENQFKVLTNLKVLYLNNNKLTYLADDVFVNLKNLKELYLQQNQLQALNLTLTNLKELVTLDLSYNHLIKLSGVEINRLPSLIYVNISHNALTKLDSDCFNRAFQLETLDLSFNNIKIPIEATMFGNNNALKYLNLFSNQIMGLEDNFMKHCNISDLNLNNNNISGEINENTFSGIRYLYSLNITQQNITGIRNKAFSNIVNLSYLNLSKNHIKIIENSSFINTSIKILDLSYNEISDLTFFKNALTNLRELIMKYNNITIITENIFQNQTHMIHLDISMNKIIKIEKKSLPLLNLQYLNLVGNKLNGTIGKDVFSPAKYLRFLDLSNFNITNIDNMTFVDLPVLVRLNLSNNQINNISTSNFKGVENMYSLDVSNNKLTNLILENISINLKALYLNNNNLTNFSKIFPNRSGLLYLDISNNNLAKFSDFGFETFPNLTTLNLARNKIKHFNNPKTNSLVSLIDLKLAHNELNSINLSHFKELMSVDISNNNLSYINTSFLQNVEYLQSLDISGNKIKFIPPGTFQFMKNLKLLNLSSTNLIKLRYGSLRGLHKTEVLDISKNNINSLDVDIFHECSELKTLIIDYNYIKTFNVERLIMVLPKLRTLSLGGNPISCKEIVRNIKLTNVTYYAIRQVEVTSVDKIYHEDNVHGIKCGDDDTNAVTDIIIEPESSTPKLEYVSSASSFTVVLIWCFVLTVVIIGAAMVIYVKYYRNRYFVVSHNTRNSLELDGSEYHNDLLN